MDRLFSATVSLIYKAKKEIESGHYSEREATVGGRLIIREVIPYQAVKRAARTPRVSLWISGA